MYTYMCTQLFSLESLVVFGTYIRLACEHDEQILFSLFIPVLLQSGGVVRQ